mmetsp:Transcript_37645/g.39104  ORF Transcript_37645/g.39104 Transcript_37645/m.39104 type:complete len:576 (-) Transcript_37645:746-2473(-)
MVERFISSNKKSLSLNDTDLSSLVSSIFVMKYSDDIEYMSTKKKKEEEKLMEVETYAIMKKVEKHFREANEAFTTSGHLNKINRKSSCPHMNLDYKYMRLDYGFNLLFKDSNNPDEQLGPDDSYHIESLEQVVGTNGDEEEGKRYQMTKGNKDKKQQSDSLSSDTLTDEEEVVSVQYYQTLDMNYTSDVEGKFKNKHRKTELNNESPKQRKLKQRQEAQMLLYSENRIQNHIKDCFPRYKLHLLKDKKFIETLKAEILRLYESKFSTESLQIMFLNKIRSNEILFAYTQDVEVTRNSTDFHFPEELTVMVNYRNVSLVYELETLYSFNFSDIVSISYNNQEVRLAVLAENSLDKLEADYNRDISDSDPNAKKKRKVEFMEKQTSVLIDKISKDGDDKPSFKEEVFFLKTLEARVLIENILSYAELNLIIYSPSRFNVSVNLFEEINLSKYYEMNKTYRTNYTQDNFIIDLENTELVYHLFPPNLNVSAHLYEEIFSSSYDYNKMLLEMRAIKGKDKESEGGSSRIGKPQERGRKNIQMKDREVIMNKNILQENIESIKKGERQKAKRSDDKKRKE